MAASSSGEKEKERLGGGLGVASGNSTRERLLSALEDLEVLSRELIEMLAISRNQKLLQAGEENQIQKIQKNGKKREKIATAVYQAKEKLKSIEKARKGAISSEEIIKYAHRISASNAVCAPLTWVPGKHTPSCSYLCFFFSPDVLAPQYPWQSNDMSMNMLPPNHSSDFLLEPPGHNKENEDDVEIMSTDSSSSSSESD
ncbi:PREDICTED: mediator of RNA polymerase II transcription subunit 4 [Mandrillus leucophaeus]|uniref:mediator of RNA polymerase II transcription subunit 4 n=1 Tax=Mandrillus leucophaeus TaxID=9568 RepID=UPI0005F42491|nr:PREDICTED: mediator of RNA polymerase II transcription subunit 4 [Mandrillus leucophaeus]